MDAGHGHSEGFEEVYLENAAGTKLTTIQARDRGGIAGAADVDGLLPASASDDFRSVSLINNPGEFTWPISAMTYVYVRQDLSFMSNIQEQALLKAFLQTLYDDEYVQQCVDAYEFAKVDGAALKIALDAIDALQVDANATQFQFELDTEENVAQGDYYISAKRRSATEVDIDVLTSANAALDAQVTELTRLLTQTREQVAQLASSASSTSATTGNEAFEIEGNAAQAVDFDNSEKDDKQDGEIAAALAMSVISIILSGIILIMLCYQKFCGTHLTAEPKANGMNGDHA